MTKYSLNHLYALQKKEALTVYMYLVGIFCATNYIKGKRYIFKISQFNLRIQRKMIFFIKICVVFFFKINKYFNSDIDK